MAPKLTDEEIRLLHELAEAGGEQSISGNRHHDGLARLVDLGFVTGQAINLSTVLYGITGEGPEACVRGAPSLRSLNSYSRQRRRPGAL